MKRDPEITAIYEAPLSAEEFDARLREAMQSLDGPEGAQLAELIAWFSRRYPTAKERLAYCRRRMKELEAAERR
ncbi:MAG: hypothetical protein KF850_23075 [Labilithrix sp.]|nr:hypothetical protein [Labilithrix sp.]